MSRLKIDDILAPVAGQAAQPVIKQEPCRAGERRCGFHILGLGQGSRERWQASWLAVQRFQLLGQCAMAPVEHHPRRCLQKHSVGLAHLIGIQDKNAAAPVEPAFAVGTHEQSLQLSAQFLSITRALHVEDDQVNLELPIAPVRVRLKHLIYQAQFLRVVDAHQENRIIARDAPAPQAGLSLTVRREHGRVGAQRRMGIDQGG